MDTGQILVMRHAEKPDDTENPNLSPAGLARAQKLVQYLTASFGKPDFLFASAFSKRSRRPYETLEPLSEACGVSIDLDLADQEYGALAHELQSKPRYDGKRTIICWHHGNIPSLAHALGARHEDYPDPWDPSVFNLILKFEFANAKPKVSKIVEPF